MKLSPSLLKAAKKIELIALDVDGVLTDGKIIIDDKGAESKHFNVRDGMGIAVALKQGLQVAVISGRYSKVVEHRAKELKIPHVYQDVADKKLVFVKLLAKLKLAPVQAAFMGDDVNDAEVLSLAGFSCAPSDADDAAKASALWVSSRRGGDGAVREMCQLIMTAQGKWARAWPGLTRIIHGQNRE
ncbi:MAG: HAD hydrolase family protein [Nitrospinae bacterium]|nr:HAD hydrolase family protein [Nitrospinota bacterium]